jgi:hypothetical protein
LAQWSVRGYVSIAFGTSENGITYVEYNGDVVSGSDSPDVMGGSDSPGDACFLAVVANPLSWITLQQSSRFGDPRRKRCMLSSDV